MEESIKCPKCSSTQLTTDKKGFSGKKALAGVVLTGGVGLLAGTIGSKKIVITCLKCGNQFKPGEDLDAKNKKDLQAKELNAKIANSIANSSVFSVFKVLTKIAFGLLAFVILFGIVLAITYEPDSKSVPTTTAVSDSTKAEDLEKYYVIEKIDIDRPTQRNLCLFIADTTKTKQVNNILIDEYNQDKSNYMMIKYFDKKGVGKNYDDKIMDEKTSDKESDKLYKHMIAVYNFNPSNLYEKLEFIHHKK